MMRNTAGYTLIELMVTVSIVGILAALALPSYQSYRLKTTRAIGEECLVNMQRRIESVYSGMNRYPSSDLSKFTADGTLNSDNSQSCGGPAVYAVSLSFPDTATCPKATCYQLTADAAANASFNIKGTQAKDGNLRLTYDATQADPSARLVREHLRPSTSTWTPSWDFQPGK